jgi:hypothetical protein
MPEMRGTQLVSEVFRLLPGTAALLMTGGVASPSDVPEGVAVIRKPFSTQELILAVQAALKQSAELCGRMQEPGEQNKQLRSGLQGAVEKSFENGRDVQNRHEH